MEIIVPIELVGIVLGYYIYKKQPKWLDWLNKDK